LKKDLNHFDLGLFI